jgi:kojibiose phosphorylase
VLARLGIGAEFDAVADGSMVTNSKPSPDIFVVAAGLLDLPPGLCVAIDDAAAGVTAAVAAGMWTIGLGPVDRVGHAHAVLAGLGGVDVAGLIDCVQDAAWSVGEAVFDPGRLRHHETVLTIGNGNLCVRGSFEEGFPGERPASFMHRVWDDMPVQVTELANLPKWWGIDVWLDDHRLRLDQGVVLECRRHLDLRSGLLRRTVRWQPEPDAGVLNLAFERFVSLAQEHVAAVRVTAFLESGEGRLRIRTGLDAHVENTGLVHWDVLDQASDARHATLRVRTRSTHTEVAACAYVTVAGAEPQTSHGTDAEGAPAVEHVLTLGPDPVVVTKTVAVVADVRAEVPSTIAVTTAARAAAEGWASLIAASAAAWALQWSDCDILVDGDPEAQIALRYNLFQLLIAAPRFTDRASIGAKTLSGFGYRHHAFWDTELFMLPPLTFLAPELARHMLMYRWHNLAGARAKARSNGFEGAQFPWESAGTGDEVTPVWVPDATDRRRLVRIWTGDIEIHITADIAYAVQQYWQVTGDDAFMRDHGAELILDGARFWASAATQEPDGRFHFRDVVGPDEYHERVDDNAFTNAMAQWHLRTGISTAAWLSATHPGAAERLLPALRVTTEVLARWADVAERMFIPLDRETGFVEQFDGYAALTDADLDSLRDPGRTSSIQHLLGIEGCARTQTLKQPDVLMFAFLLPDAWTPQQHAVNYAYYDPRTDHEHGSSLGPAISAIIACRNGDIEQGYRHFLRAARADLLDVRHNTEDGIHGASAGGLWQAAVLGFAGVTVTTAGVQTRPRLPATWRRLAFRCTVGGVGHEVSLTA